MNARLARDSVVAASDVDAHAHRLQAQMAIFRLGGATAERGAQGGRAGRARTAAAG